MKNALDVLKTDNIKIEKAYRKIKPLATMASGATSGDGKISFENYVMGTMFRDVLNYANARLTIMSGGQYKLHHSMSAARANSQGRLEIEIEDAITNTRRKPGSFSGGETLLASMSLALGLADVVQNQAGGMSMDAIFIDEGFGSLSDDKLDLVRSILESLSHGSRQVAVISHVHKLE